MSVHVLLKGLHFFYNGEKENQLEHKTCVLNSEYVFLII